MIKLTTILLEQVHETFQFTALLKNYKNINKSVIINELRAVPYVIRIKIVDDRRLAIANRKNDYEYTLLKVKFLNVMGTPMRTINLIKGMAVNGNKVFHKIDGVIDFKPLVKTLHKVV
jgi:hypothetical protein